ncbi:MAG: hypothetical protein IKL02_04415 [Kiritimatiellae bacterium]|nr:hypothetical protein [Kiritimatiellia bacterium]
MKVMMIGLSRAGKTSYMGAMYKRFEEGIGGFSIKAINSEDGRALQKIGNNLSKGIYPGNTDIRSEYKFKLLYENSELMEFDWTDYRGGLLVDFNNEKELDKWECELQSADAVIAFLDSSAMDRRTSVNRYSGFSQMEAISDLITRVASSHSDNEAFPISFVMTKIDALKDNKIEGDEWEQLGELMKDVASSKNIHGMLTGTVVGKECLNIEWPFLMSMVFGLKGKIARVCAEADALKDRVNDCIENTSIWDDISSWWNDEPSYRSIAYDNAVELQKKVNRLMALSTPTDLLIDLLKKVSADEDFFMHLF